MTPATTDALDRLAAGWGTLRGVHARHALLALATLADRDLNSPNGLSYVTADRVAQVVGLAPSTIARTLRGLAADGHAVVVVSWATTRHHLTGPDSERLNRGARVLGFRPSEEAYR